MKKTVYLQVNKLNKDLIKKICGGCWCFKKRGYVRVEDDEPVDPEPVDFEPSTFKISSVNKYFFVETIGRNVDFAEGRKGRVKLKGGVMI